MLKPMSARKQPNIKLPRNESFLILESWFLALVMSLGLTAGLSCLTYVLPSMLIVSLLMSVYLLYSLFVFSSFLKLNSKFLLIKGVAWV